MIIRQLQNLRTVHSIIGVCLVLLFTAYSQINAIDNIKHFGPIEQHEHSALSLVTVLDDHDHHHHDNDREHHQPADLPSPGEHPDHAHPNLLGSMALNPVAIIAVAPTVTNTVVSDVPRDGPVTGYLQQALDRPPKREL